MAKLTEDMIDWAYEKRLDGYSFRQIAGALHVGCATIFEALSKRGLVRELPPLLYEPRNSEPMEPSRLKMPFDCSKIGKGS